MKKHYTPLLIVALSMALFASCKKDYTCECSDGVSKKEVLTISGTRKEAYDQCMEYYNRNYAQVSMTENGCRIK